MLIWSILTPEAWHELNRKGYVRADRRHADEYFIASYDWMADQMERRLKTPRPSKSAMPIWAWFQWYGNKRQKPDLRSLRHWHPKGERAVRVGFRVDDDRVLLSDFELWHYVLNYWYLPKTFAEGDAFEAKLEAAGLSTYRHSHEDPIPRAKYRREVEWSWERIFDIEWCEPAITHLPKTRSIQATLWELRRDDVVDAVQFVGACA